MHEADAERIRRAVGKRPAEMVPAGGHGAPSNRRWIVSFADGTRAFAKVAAFDYTADWLRIERTNYEALSGRHYLPSLLGWDDDGAEPTLVLEDLSGASWPPPWIRRRSTRCSRPSMPSARPRRRIGSPRPSSSGSGRSERAGGRCGEDPDGTLALGVFDEAWLRSNIDELEQAADDAVLDGDALVHGDIRSDNLCLVDGRAVLVDWNWASRGAPLLDLAAWLPSLHREGGPPPWTLLKDQGPLASLLAGFFLYHAGMDPIPQAPHVRRLQLEQGLVALTWVCRELGLAPPASMPRPD